MRPIVTDIVAWSVCRSVSHDREPCKTAEPIDMPFELWTQVGPRNHVLGGDARWRHLANKTESSMRSGDVVFFKLL